MRYSSILLVVFNLLLLTEGKKRHDKVWKQRKAECEAHNCEHLHVDENMNCVNECTSSECFTEIYAAEPLEDGEIDTRREKQFQSCLRREVKESKQRKWKDIHEAERAAMAERDM
jgi:hypothetical protein